MLVVGRCPCQKFLRSPHNVPAMNIIMVLVIMFSNRNVIKHEQLVSPNKSEQAHRSQPDAQQNKCSYTVRDERVDAELMTTINAKPTTH